MSAAQFDVASCECLDPAVEQPHSTYANVRSLSGSKAFPACEIATGLGAFLPSSSERDAQDALRTARASRCRSSRAQKGSDGPSTQQRSTGNTSGRHPCQDPRPPRRSARDQLANVSAHEAELGVSCPTAITPEGRPRENVGQRVANCDDLSIGASAFIAGCPHRDNHGVGKHGTGGEHDSSHVLVRPRERLAPAGSGGVSCRPHPCVWMHNGERLYIPLND